MLNEAEVKELLSFLQPETRPDVKGHATEYILGLSADREGLRFLCSKPELLVAMFALTSDPSIAIAKDCYHALINLSADETLHQVLVTQVGVLPRLVRTLVEPGFMLADQTSTVLANLSRHPRTCPLVFQTLQAAGGLERLVEVFCKEGHNKMAALHYLGPLLSNLTQLAEARRHLLEAAGGSVFQRLLPFTRFQGSTVRRGGAVGTIRNCCFHYTHHEWLLSDTVDLLPFLLLPLAGPEELTDEENDGLPVDLQYLPEDKTREEDPDIRKMLLETLLLLAATKSGRQTLKKKNVYPIIRELHRWETDPQVSSACEKLIQVLIGDEPEEGMENLMELHIPTEVEQKLKEADKMEELQEDQKE